MAIDKIEHLRVYLKSLLGDPVVEICEQELKAFDPAISAASIDYWLNQPHVKTGNVSGTSVSSTTTVDLNTLMDGLFTDPEIRDAVYFVGIVRYDVAGLEDRLHGYDRCLSGSEGHNVDHRGYSENQIYLSDNILLRNTNRDLVFGELDYNYNDVEEKIEFILPDQANTVTVWYGFGFDPESTIKYVPMRNFDLFRKLVAKSYLEAIIAARTTIELQSDYTVNVSAIETTLEGLKEKLNEELISMSRFTAQWG